MFKLKPTKGWYKRAAKLKEGHDVMAGSTRKPFDEKLFVENDARARQAVSQYLRSHGIVVRPNEDKFGVDLFELEDSEENGPYPVLGIECEIKLVWHGSNFPWDTIQLPERKAKYRRPLLDVDYWVLNSECTHAIVIPGYLLDRHTPVEVPNVYVAKGEKFYQIPVSECRKVDLSE